MRAVWCAVWKRVKVEAVAHFLQGMITGLSLPETGDQRLMNFTLARPSVQEQGTLLARVVADF